MCLNGYGDRLMKQKIKIRQMPSGSLSRIFELFTRDQLRELAKTHNIPIGRNKSDTVLNLYLHRGKMGVRNRTLFIRIV